MNNILIVLPNDGLGGAEQYLKMIASYYSNKGDFVYVFFLKKKMYSGWEDIKSNKLFLFYTNARNEKFGLLPLIRNIYKKKKLHFDYVYTSHVHCTTFVGVFIKLKIIKTKNFIARESTSVFTRFSGFTLVLFKLQYRIGYRHINLLICQTTFMKEQLTNALPWLEKRTTIKVIPNPIDIENIKIKSSQKTDIILNYPYIISAGRLIDEKGFDILIKSFKIIIQNHNELKLLILGNGIKKDELLNLISQLGLQDRISLMGFKQNVYPYFRQARLCVVSSRIEGFPNVLLQMMSQNTKVVSTTCAGDIDNIAGIYTCEPNNVDDLAKSINRCLSEQTDNNRIVFDNELKKRSIENFIQITNSYVCR